MLCHRLEHDVLVITVDEDPGISGRAGLATRITDLVHTYRPSSVLLVIGLAAATPATASAVLRAHRRCGETDTVLSVATQDAATRRLLEDNADSRGPKLVVRDRVDLPVGTAYVPAA
ncbi:hypothetical protein [Streptomyces sp. JH34]|uniref:hypothetical protein n=1 Tax=unclassified Streptomyces TaxID=2593676 RepID=UPI0023F7CBF2|nr:hypothetical protein [Streptomyces sp. JH34]MDF6022992.1 hypothetical protein [Streptomyces sp. JH34]